MNTVTSELEFASTEAPPAARSSKRVTLALALSLAALTSLLYASSLGNDFVNYDDPDYVTNNWHVLQGLSWHNVVWALAATVQANWHPLTWLSHMADVQLFGLHASGHHLVNLLLHALNVVLLFLLLKSATRRLYRSAFVAALFAVCPLNVESVAWIAQRKSLLSTAFLLLALFAYGWYARRPAVGRYLAVAALFALGLMAKPMVLTLPLLLLLADYWPLGRLAAPGELPAAQYMRQIVNLASEKIPLLALSAASAIITVYAQRAGGALGSAAILPLRLRVENAIYSYLAYVIKAIWPARLAVFYPHPESSLALWKVLAGALFLVATTALAWTYRRQKWLLAGWLWYVVTLIPVIGIVQVGMQAMADRYAYVPLIGLFVIATWLAAELAQTLRISNGILARAAIVLLAAYAVVSYIQIGYWRNSYTLFSHAVKVTNRNAIAEDNLGATLVTMGRPDLAAPHIEKAILWMPQLSLAHYNHGVLLQTEGHYEQAVTEYRVALKYVSDPVEAASEHNNLGATFVALHEPAAAVAEFSAAIDLNPGEQNSFLGRGLIEYRSGNLAAAEDDFKAGTQIAPSPAGLLWLGQVMEDRGEVAAAKETYMAALKIAPNFPEAEHRLAALDARAQGTQVQ